MDASGHWINFLWTLPLLMMLFALQVHAEAVTSIEETLVDRTVGLPCLATEHPHHDTPVLLLFYRHQSNIPFFSYDARNGDFWRGGTSKTRDARYEGRVHLNLMQPRRVMLNMEHISLTDAGDFTCRVDFLGSPSLTSIVKLVVYEAPVGPPSISVSSGPIAATEVTTRSHVGPFHEGQMLNFSCVVLGGHPSPAVTWWQDTTLLDNSSRIERAHPDKVVNDMLVGPLSRDLVRLPFTCRAENNPLSPPLDRTIHVKIHMAPQTVRLPPSPTVRATLEERLECRAEGAYPEANITWTLRGRPLNFTAKETRQLGTDTVSWVRFVASPQDNGAPLTCTASSPTLPDPPVSVTVTLNVTHAPSVRLSLGSSLSVDRIRQGDDVYFACVTSANPSVQRIAWYKGDMEVRHNVSGGILVNGNNLVLQGVQRRDAGVYTCTATNAVATTSSQALHLNIQYVPMCAQGPASVTAVEGVVVKLHCRVNAHPSNVSFSWLFNNTVESSRFRPSDFSVTGEMSTLPYVAYSARDYGTIFCWASNAVGTQERPCAFTVQPAGVPDMVRDCAISNQSAGSLHIACQPGADGGLMQSFRASVYKVSAEEPLRVLEGMTPVFEVEGLEPGGDYIVEVIAVNSKGSSPPETLEAFTLKVAENRMISGVSNTAPEPKVEELESPLSPLLGVFLGIVGAFLLLAAAAIFITRRHCPRGHGRTPDLVAGQELDTRTDGAPVSNKSNSHEPIETPDLTESDPFLLTSESTSAGTPGSGSGVFSIPAHIPPPPQYCTEPCTELSPTQHVVHHPAPVPHPPPSAHHTLPRSMPHHQSQTMQQPQSREYPCTGHQTLQQVPSISCSLTTAHQPGTIHYIQPHPGLCIPRGGTPPGVGSYSRAGSQVEGATYARVGTPPKPLVQSRTGPPSSSSHHSESGLRETLPGVMLHPIAGGPCNRDSGSIIYMDVEPPMRSQVVTPPVHVVTLTTHVSGSHSTQEAQASKNNEGAEPPLQHSSPKTLPKHVTWAGGTVQTGIGHPPLSQGEESQV